MGRSHLTEIPVEADDLEEIDPPRKRRAPINSERARAEGGIPLSDKIAKKYGIAKVEFSRDGYPIWPASLVTQTVTITYQGSRTRDFTAARDAVREKLGDPNWEKPEGYTWHHHQDMKTMQLVPTDLHREVKHSGGVSAWVYEQREASGSESLKYDSAGSVDVAQQQAAQAQQGGGGRIGAAG